MFETPKNCRQVSKAFDYCPTGCVEFKLGCPQKEDDFAECIEMDACEKQSRFTTVMIGICAALCILCVVRAIYRCMQLRNSDPADQLNPAYAPFPNQEPYPPNYQGNQQYGPA